MSRLLLQLALSLATAFMASGQTIEKDPNFCTAYQNLSQLFNNTDSSVNEVILGFQEMTWRPYEEQTQSPCVYLSGTENTQIFIQVETEGELCIDIETGDSTCGSGTIERCGSSPVSTGVRQYIYFTCLQSCSTSSFPFLFRVIQSASSGNLEYWCTDIAGPPNDVYPQDVIYEQVGGTGVSFSRTFQQTPAPVGGSATGIIINKFVLLLLLAVLL